MLVPVKQSDDHRRHIVIHLQANATPSTIAHIKTHEQFLKQARENPNVFKDPMNQQQQTQDAQAQSQNAQSMIGAGIGQQLTPSKTSAVNNLMTQGQ